MPKTIVITIPGMISDVDLAPLRLISDVIYKEVQDITEDDLISSIEGYDYLMLNYDVIKKITPGFYRHENVRALKAISVDITGMDWASPQSAAQQNVLLLNIPHYSTESVAESILAEVLLHAKQRHGAYIDEIRGRPVQARKGINLAGKTAGIVGLGSIGRQVAKLLAGLGMNVIAWNRTPREGHDLVSLDDVFAKSAVIAFCLKTVTTGEDQNTNLIDDRLLEKCNGSILVNLASPQLIDHKRIAHFIHAGNISAYSVERSPGVRASPLAAMDAVHLAPANAWYSDESLAALRSTWVENIMSAIKGRAQNAYRE